MLLANDDVIYALGLAQKTNIVTDAFYHGRNLCMSRYTLKETPEPHEWSCF